MKVVSRWQRIPWAPISVGLLTSLLLLLGSQVLARHAGPLLARMDISVGEVLKDRGMRFEQAGETDTAAQAYAMALAGTFNGAEHRAEAQEHLGRILLEAGEADRAVALLEQVAGGTHGRPSAKPALCEALVAAGRVDAARKLLAMQKLSEDTENYRSIALCKACIKKQDLTKGTVNIEELLRSVRAPDGLELIPVLGPRLLASERYEELGILLIYYIAAGEGRRTDTARAVRTQLPEADSRGVLTVLKQIAENS